MQGLVFEVSGDAATADQAVEMVERKGVGHPDYICDAVMERVSVELSRAYLKSFGEVLHHNIDKGLLIAGTVRKGFGGGRVISPMEFVVGDRATFRAGDAKIPVEEIAESSVRSWLRENLRHIDPERHVNIRVALKPGSSSLSDIFRRKGRIKGANDTSAAVGYAPLTPTEKAVLQVERFINSQEFKLRFPETGEDVKVMGMRKGASLDLTVACPLMAGFIKGEKAYFSKKADVLKALNGFCRGIPGFKATAVNLNTLDRRGHGSDGVYLTLLGTSAEDADSGQVGRGNRVNGVISLGRPMGTEAAAGKNPVSHVGKIYSILCHRIAGRIYEGVSGVREVYVWLLSQIGSPIDSPKSAYVRLIPEKGAFDKRSASNRASAILEEALSDIRSFTDGLSRGEYPVC